MILKAIVDEQLFELNLPASFMEKAQEFFEKMDTDLDKGWQVDREWYDDVSPLMRTQIVADKLLTALENEDDKLGRMMAGYIIFKNPGIDSIELSTQGETRDHQVHFQEGAETLFGFSPSTKGLPTGMSQEQALEQAKKDVSQVFKMGRQYRFTVFNHGSQAWDESPAVGSKTDAEAMREAAFKARFDAICANS